MPIFEYQCKTGAGCGKCSSGFEHLKKSGEPELSHCPGCGAPVTKIVSAPSIGKASPSLDPKNLERHGFTQYRKSAKGVYEKTAGKGPVKIEKD